MSEVPGPIPSPFEAEDAKVAAERAMAADDPTPIADALARVASRPDDADALYAGWALVEAVCALRGHLSGWVPTAAAAWARRTPARVDAGLFRVAEQVFDRCESVWWVPRDGEDAEAVTSRRRALSATRARLRKPPLR
jgi:hypothetical protein